jgi:hypothetical protein
VDRKMDEISFSDAIKKLEKITDIEELYNQNKRSRTELAKINRKFHNDCYEGPLFYSLNKVFNKKYKT